MFKFDNSWNLQPIKGDTGKAYKGIRDSESVFIKRNSTPFLAALSREGLTPKLLWTKRTSDGDVLTAQEWLDGRQLTPEEMSKSGEVIRILQHLHQSDSLKSMLQRMDGREKSAFDFLSDYALDLPDDLKKNLYLMRVFRYLEDHLPSFHPVYYTACHGDPMHNNWLLSTEDTVFLVDWDYSVLADPALDIGTILGQYIDIKYWDYWVAEYGATGEENIMDRVYWYAGINLLLQIKRSYLHYEREQMNAYIAQLKKIYKY
ncbi:MULTISPECIES: phosphotransferase family protein [Vagococcus]|uniref:Aminoglycoside phosphotransferase family protein n=1 Tax=Vagococcus fluvialis bH819 TaxID=1255619 RepID=A0A1X6WLQ7_9ENTE|nr:MULTISPECIES: phosphotransferase family protein [Vagococcus]SLM85188.1 aminoglycoside phosphotransferase family protein [Vagococcus fluvialis bH819]HCM88399.1 aminoglycoside phosphotransferase [Vagococcus sp.]